MSTRYYPLYQKGNPQLRIFLPNFWMKLLKPQEPLPPNVVLFQTSIEMTKYDIKNYLEKIYNVPVIDVRVTIKSGAIKKSLYRMVKDDDYKEAFVYLPKDYHFEFPSISLKPEETEKETLKTLKEEYKNNVKDCVPFLPKWFTK